MVAQVVLVHLVEVRILTGEPFLMQFAEERAAFFLWLIENLERDHARFAKAAKKQSLLLLD